MTDDHKVVGLQYAVGVLLFLFTGGLLAMLIRTELLSPTNHVFGPGTYIAIVGEHGTIMMMMASSAVVGPARQLAGPAHDRLAAHGLPPGRGLLVLDLHGRLPRHPERAVLRRLPDRVDRLRPAADAGGRGAWTPIWSASP